MGSNRRQFMLSTLGLAVAAKLEAATGISLQPTPTGGAETASEAAYGSSHFGRWAEDEFGLPIFKYTCNQTTDPKAVSPLKPGILLPTEHIHQVGNDRITALASNYGHVRVRQDEGGSRILNDVEPDVSQFGGGVGYLTDGRETLSTWFDGSDLAFERTFGVGYFRKTVASRNYRVEQTMWAPFGDDPVLISQVRITNLGTAPADLNWVEYWGCQPYELSMRDFVEAPFMKDSVAQLRRKNGKLFSHHIGQVGAMAGLIDKKTFMGRDPEEAVAFKSVGEFLKVHPASFVGKSDEEKPGKWYNATELPQTFLVSLDEPADALGTDAAAFFGPGGPVNPTGLKNGLAGSYAENPAHPGMFLSRKLRLAPKEERGLSFMYGYLSGGFTLEALIPKYQAAVAHGLNESTAEWNRHGLRIEAAGEPWVKREAIWNYYYTRSSMTYDDYFGEHVLNQNGIYQYVIGFLGSMRDTTEHALPFIFSDPEITKSSLRYVLKTMRDDNSIPYSIAGHGMFGPTSNENCSDSTLFPIWAVSEYVLATRDTAFLDERLSLPNSNQAGRTDTVRNLLARCYQDQVERVGVGEFGLVRTLNDDWEDGFAFTFAAAAFEEFAAKGVSMQNTTMSVVAFDNLAKILRLAGDATGLADRAEKHAEQLRQAARKQWTGKWLKRVWLGPTLGWLGEDNLWIEPHLWAAAGGVITEEQNRELVVTMNTLLRRNPIGAASVSIGPDYDKCKLMPPGEAVNGAVWPCFNQFLVGVIARVDPAMAFDEWKKNSLARHSHVYPDLWYGTWSGPDAYNSVPSKEPGAVPHLDIFNVAEFPVFNVHSHACYLYGATRMLGVEFTQDGFTLAPEIPVDSYRLDSPLLGVVKKSVGHYEGWYAPAQAGTWSIRVRLPEAVAKGVSKVEVNGVASPVRKHGDGTIGIVGSSEPGKPLRWAAR